LPSPIPRQAVEAAVQEPKFGLPPIEGEQADGGAEEAPALVEHGRRGEQRSTVRRRCV